MKKLGWRLLGIAGIVILIAIGVWVWQWQSNSQSTNNVEQSKPVPLGVAFKDIVAGQSLSGVVTIALGVSDLSRVTRAEYYVDNQLEAVTYTYPFTFNFDTSQFSRGEHVIVAKVFDKDGNEYVASPIKVMVNSSDSTDKNEDVVESNSSTTNNPTSPQSSPRVSSRQNDNFSKPAPSLPGGDTIAPSSPSSLMLSASDGYTTNLSWSPSTDNVGVDGYQVFRDGIALSPLLSSGTMAYVDQTVVPGNTYEYSVKAQDVADNVSAPSNAPEVTLVPTSIWVDADSPRLEDASDDPYELGVRFRPLVDGKVTGVKFYKVASSTGVHEGNLWSSDGTQHLANVTFADESASGWQQATFDVPVDVTAGVTYVVSYTAPNGGFGYTPNYFTDGGITSQYLTAMESGVDGDNGVYGLTPGAFPSESYVDTHYWVDALFIPNESAGGPSVKTLDTSQIFPGFPGSNNTGIPVGKRLPTRDRSIQIFADNAILENIEISGSVDIRADNILVRNTKVNSFVYLDTDAPGAIDWHFIVRDSEINAGSNQRGGVTLGNFTLERVNLYGGQMNALCGGSCTVTDSWFHGQYLPPDQDWHLGGFLSNGGSNMVIKNNTINCDTQNNQVGGGCSGNLNLFGDFAGIKNILIEGNLFPPSPGATYCVNLGYNAFKPYGNQAENIDVINNIFVRGPGGKCASVAVATDYMISGMPAPGSSWVNNKWDDGDLIPAPE